MCSNKCFEALYHNELSVSNALFLASISAFLSFTNLLNVYWYLKWFYICPSRIKSNFYRQLNQNNKHFPWRDLLKEIALFLVNILPSKLEKTIFKNYLEFRNDSIWLHFYSIWDFQKLITKFHNRYLSDGEDFTHQYLACIFIQHRGHRKL